jgi:hypothetical protein
MHLTNYSVNKHSDAFVSAAADDEGTKRQGLTLAHVRAHLEQLQDTFMS